MLPVTHGAELTRLHIWLYTVLLFVVSLLPYLVGMSGPIYLAGAVVFGARFLRHAWKLWRHDPPRQAIRTFAYSINYLMGLFAAMMIDHYLPLAVDAVSSLL